MYLELCYLLKNNATGPRECHIGEGELEEDRGQRVEENRESRKNRAVNNKQLS